MAYKTRVGHGHKCMEDMPCWDARTMGNKEGWHKGKYYKNGKPVKDSRNYIQEAGLMAYQARRSRGRIAPPKDLKLKPKPLTPTAAVRAAMLKTQKGLGGAVLIGKRTRGPGPNATIEAQAGSGSTESDYRRGRREWHVFTDSAGQRHVNSFLRSTKRKLK